MSTSSRRQISTSAASVSLHISPDFMATHLITGYLSYFGRFFGERLQGVIVMPPAGYLASREKS